MVHALLAHLESVSFTGAPRFLGIDGSGREVLTYIDGEVAGPPRPAWIAGEQRAEPPGTPPAPAYPPELIGHVDITPENVVFRDGRAYALIDFDLARPATRADRWLAADVGRGRGRRDQAPRSLAGQVRRDADRDPHHCVTAAIRPDRVLARDRAITPAPHGFTPGRRGGILRL